MVPAVLSALAVPPLPTRAAAAAPHVMVVVEENREYPEVIGNPSAPYVNSLASQYGLATQAYATTHPSLPNYLELIAGTTFGITDDCTACSVEGTTLVDQLQASGLDWLLRRSLHQRGLRQEARPVHVRATYRRQSR